MFLAVMRVGADERVKGLGGGRTVARVRYEVETSAPFAERVGVGDGLNRVSAYVVDGDGVKRVDTMEPFTVELEHLFIEGGVVREGVFDVVNGDFAAKLAHHVPKLVHYGLAGAHRVHVKRALVCVISG